MSKCNATQVSTGGTHRHPKRRGQDDDGAEHAQPARHNAKDDPLKNGREEELRARSCREQRKPCCHRLEQAHLSVRRQCPAAGLFPLQAHRHQDLRAKPKHADHEDEEPARDAGGQDKRLVEYNNAADGAQTSYQCWSAWSVWRTHTTETTTQ